MRRRDLLLRMAARRGEPGASLEIARRYFLGGDSFPKNIELGLAYLQQGLLRESTAAVELVGELVPLETAGCGRRWPSWVFCKYCAPPIGPTESAG